MYPRTKTYWQSQQGSLHATRTELRGHYSRLLGKESLVSIGIGKEGLRIDDSLVVHQLVPFVLGEGVKLVVFGVPDDLVGFDDLRLAWF